MIVKLRKMLPHTLFHHDVHLMVFKPRGIITEKRLNGAIKMLEREEDRAQIPFNRFTDLSKVEGIDVDFKAMFRFSLHRRLSYSRRLPVKSAIYVTTPTAVRLIKIHILLTDYSPLKVKMFTDLAVAARWLGVSLETLVIDPWGEGS